MKKEIGMLLKWVCFKNGYVFKMGMFLKWVFFIIINQ